MDSDRTSERLSVDVEVVTDGSARRPDVDRDTRIDVTVEDRVYPTARAADGSYVAWWFNAEAPAPDSAAVERWVKAPTRFLAAGTLHELWQDPTALDHLRGPDRGSDPGPDPNHLGPDADQDPDPGPDSGHDSDLE